MLELTKEVDERVAKKWSAERIKAEMAETNVSDLMGLIWGFILIVCLLAGLFFMAVGLGIYTPAILWGMVFLALSFFGFWYFYKRNKRYKQLRKLLKAKL